VTSPTPEALWSARAVRLLRPSAVLCRGLTRSVGGRRLLDDLDLTVPVGARLLLVSDPPASAALLLRILAGLARSDAGSLRIAGLSSPGPDGWGSRIGYLGRPSGVPRWMTPREALRFSGGASGLDADGRERRCEEILERFGLVSFADRPIGRLISALAERVGLAATLVSDPEVLLLDEPLGGHDPLGRELLLQPSGPRRTILIASRVPAAERNVCDQVALLRDGRLAVHATFDELESEGLPLTREGIEELAARRSPPRPLAAPAEHR
jgi:ABC-2 type transport system ATP-binding protein